MEKSNKLDSEKHKKSVFLTQSQDKDEDEDVQGLSSFSEPSDKLFDNDKKKLQRSLLVKKEDPLDRIKQELSEKRRQFDARMEGFGQRKSALEEKRQKMKDRVARFERFIRENNVKRERALIKYQNENQEYNKKSQECNLLYERIIELKKRYAYFTKKIEKYGIYKNFLNKIIETLPEDYVCVSDDKVHSLLLRYQTLNATNDKLIQRLNNAGNQLEQLRQSQEEMQGIHDRAKFEANHEMADLIKELKRHSELNEKKEQLLMRTKGDHMEKKLELGVILLAIDTIIDKCREDSCKQKEELTVDEKLTYIKEWLLDQSGIVELVQTEMAQIPEERPPMNPVNIRIIEPAYKAK